MKAENLRNPKMVLHVPIAASKLELLASKRNRAFFLRHPVFNFLGQEEQEEHKNVCISFSHTTGERIQILKQNLQSHSLSNKMI